MLSAQRSLALNITSGKPLPRIEALRDLYAAGTNPRHGEVIMVAGRGGSQKSGFALWFCDQLDLPTLYFSADMSAFTASSRIASTRTGKDTDEVERIMSLPDGDLEKDLLNNAIADSKITFSFGGPIQLDRIDDELDAYLEVFDRYPQIIVIDNLMDMENAEADYQVQMQAMSRATELARDTGCNVIVLHHASDKSWDAKKDPWKPPARSEIKNGMGEKPELVLTVGLNPDGGFHIATVKQRMGPCDPTGRKFITLDIQPELTRFHARERGKFQ